MKNRKNNTYFPYTMPERFDYFDAKMHDKAESIFDKVYRGECSSDERVALIRAIRELYLDRDNYPRSFNLRIARKFDSSDLNTYYDGAKNGYRKFYDTTIYSHGGNFYFGFNHN